MADAALEFESLQDRIEEMERELQSLRKLLVERMPQLIVGDLEVRSGVTVQETLAAATLREGGQSLGENILGAIAERICKGRNALCPSLS
jgi:hypothetical protein